MHFAPRDTPCSRKSTARPERRRRARVARLTSSLRGARSSRWRPTWTTARSLAGEPSLDGSVRHGSGILPMAHLAQQLGYKSLLGAVGRRARSRPHPGHRRLPRRDAGPPGHALPRLLTDRALPRHSGPRPRPAGLRRRFLGHKRVDINMKIPVGALLSRGRGGRRRGLN